jgi:hypothetical protein
MGIKLLDGDRFWMELREYLFDAVMKFKETFFEGT